MKKFFALLMTFAVLLGMTSCTSCNREKEQIGIIVEETVMMDRKYMCDSVDSGYFYYETQIVLNEYIDEEDCTGAVASVMNVFQIVEGGDTAYLPHVYMFTHTDSTSDMKVVDDTWLEDYDMAKEDITVTYSQAYDNLMKADCVKPHSKNCTLRKMVGPYLCNPQYIFGNMMGDCVFVDSKTGVVSDKNPAFDR